MLLYLATLVLYSWFNYWIIYECGNLSPKQWTWQVCLCKKEVINRVLQYSISWHFSYCVGKLMPLWSKFWSVLNQVFLMQFHVLLWNYYYTIDKCPLYPRPELSDVKLNFVWGHSKITTFKYYKVLVSS